MSTELFEAKGLVDEIFGIAGVSAEINDPHFYNTALAQISALIVAMDKFGLSMDEQRRRMGAKKDELISELIRLLNEGVIIGENDEGRPRAEPLRGIRVTRV